MPSFWEGHFSRLYRAHAQIFYRKGTRECRFIGLTWCIVGKQEETVEVRCRNRDFSGKEICSIE